MRPLPPLAQRAHSVRRFLRVNRLPEPRSLLSMRQGLAGAAAADLPRRQRAPHRRCFAGSGVSGRKPPTPHFKSGRLVAFAELRTPARLGLLLPSLRTTAPLAGHPAAPQAARGPSAEARGDNEI